MVRSLWINYWFQDWFHALGSQLQPAAASCGASASPLFGRGCWFWNLYCHYQLLDEYQSINTFHNLISSRWNIGSVLNAHGCSWRFICIYYLTIRWKNMKTPVPKISILDMFLLPMICSKHLRKITYIYIWTND